MYRLLVWAQDIVAFVVSAILGFVIGFAIAMIERKRKGNKE